MLISLSYILLFGMLFGALCKRAKIPSLFGMILTGIILGPNITNLLDPSILNISIELRRIALIIILMRSGLSLNIRSLKEVGLSAILMCFIPASLEILGMFIFAPLFLHISKIDALILGSVIAAVSPAVVVPRMIRFKEEGYGLKKNIPEMILFGSNVDDVFVIVLFTSFLALGQGNEIQGINFIQIPISIISGAIIGFFTGLGLGIYFKKVHIRDTIKVFIILSIAFILNEIESVQKVLPFSALIAVMAMGLGLQEEIPIATPRMSSKFNKLWLGAEVFLFVLVGATVDLSYVLNKDIVWMFLVLALCLIFRIIGVFICMIPTSLNLKEKIFTAISYIPKATVQAAIGGIPLSLGLQCGNLVLTVAVLCILITAPIGAFLMDSLYTKCLTKD